MDKRKLPLGYGGTYLHADVCLLHFLHALKLNGGSINSVNAELLRVIGRKVDISKFRDGNEMRTILTEVETKKRGDL